MPSGGASEAITMARKASLIRCAVTATMQVNGERFVHEFTVAKKRGCLGQLAESRMLAVSKVSVDARGYNQFTVGDVGAMLRPGPGRRQCDFPLLSWRVHVYAGRAEQ